MRRRIQFSLRVIFAITAVVAAGFAIWIKLPIQVRLAIGAGATGLVLSLVIWQFDLGLAELLARIARGGSARKHVIKIRGKHSGPIDPQDES